DRRRFVRIFWFTGMLHALFLVMSFHLNPVLPLNEAVQALLTLSDLASSNTSKAIIVNIASHNANKAVSEENSTTPTTNAAQPILRKRTISAATHLPQDADYLTRWQNYVEQFGNDHYPADALKNNICGNLRLLVAINQDGTIHEIHLRQSSGSVLLDQSAINIVKMAAPFEPLPANIANDVDVLEIIRTWQFRGNSFSSHS
ncbi:MAG TPA: TonB family protein, partial [Candidatus Berkiella sp.]|nr:TonB family protein [Candidatus Berkiella sp.]